MMTTKNNTAPLLQPVAQPTKAERLRSALDLVVWDVGSSLGGDALRSVAADLHVLHLAVDSGRTSDEPGIPIAQVELYLYRLALRAEGLAELVDLAGEGGEQ